MAAAVAMQETENVLAWVLNLDADLELAEDKPYTPTANVFRAVEESLPRARTLLDPADVLIEDPRARGRIGRAFCPTRRAVAALIAGGAVPEPHPSHEILRRVNDRGFCASLGQTLGGVFVRSLDDALRVLECTPPFGDGWRVKRAFGMAGRGQWKIPAGGPRTAADHAFLRAAAEGLQIEPNVPIDRELALHGIVSERGDLRLGRLVEQVCDARGRWQSSHLARDEVPEIGAEAIRVAEALHRAGYFGPFGIDAFLYRTATGLQLQPRSEINARYAMGFRVGFAVP
jgi:hypothetical protein